MASKDSHNVKKKRRSRSRSNSKKNSDSPKRRKDLSSSLSSRSSASSSLSKDQKNKRSHSNSSSRRTSSSQERSRKEGRKSYRYDQDRRKRNYGEAYANVLQKRKEKRFAPPKKGIFWTIESDDSDVEREHRALKTKIEKQEQEMDTFQLSSELLEIFDSPSLYRKPKKRNLSSSSSEAEESDTSEKKKAKKKKKKKNKKEKKEKKDKKEKKNKGENQDKEGKKKKKKKKKKNKKEKDSSGESDGGNDSDPFQEKPIERQISKNSRNDNAEDNKYSFVGPQPVNLEALTDKVKANFSQQMLPGEADAMAQFIQEGKRIPRRGEVGLSSEQISRFEDLGYVMSGSRNRRINAMRLKKESQVYSVERERAQVIQKFEEKLKREHRLIEEMKGLLDSKAAAADHGSKQHKK